MKNKAVVITCTLAALAATAAGQNANNPQWVGTWSASMVQPSPGPPQLTNTGFSNQTIRQIVRTSIGGNRVRIRLSTFGMVRLEIGSAHIALRSTDAGIVPGSDRTLTFSNEPTIVIPAGAVVMSDPVDLDIPPASDVAVSIFVPGSTGPATWHFAALQNTYISPPGDFTGTVAMPVNSVRPAWFWLAGVEVMTSRPAGAIVAFGDSITDGGGSTANANNRWPDFLARRVLAQAGINVGVLNQGLSGNRVSHDGIGPNVLARFDRDVLTQPGVTHVIVLAGNNDFLFVFDPAEDVHYNQVIEGYKQMIYRARALGLTIYGATLTPFGGFAPFATPEKEAKRQAVNRWIRSSGAFDAVIDFDAVLRDPGDVSKLREAFDSGDHLHPNDAGYRAMADAVDLTLFRRRGNP